MSLDLRGHGAPASKQRQDEHRRRKESGEPREKGKKPEKEKTFWEKNWMYIVPISFLVSNALSAPPPRSTVPWKEPERMTFPYGSAAIPRPDCSLASPNRWLH